MFWPEVAFFRDEYIQFWLTKVIQGVHRFVYILVVMATKRYMIWVFIR